jgi:uncharacterized protein
VTDSSGPDSSGPDSSGPSLERRDRTIDALRGLCLLGIALVNVPWIGLAPPLPDLLWDDARREALPWHDLVAALFVEGLCEGKFYPQFGALFGFGTAILIARGRAAYLRRIGVLFAFGVLHAVFGWWGDILFNYGCLGVLLLLFERLPSRGLLGLSAVLLALTTAVSLRFDTWFAPEVTDAEAAAEHAAYVARQIAIYRDGDLATITLHRWEELLAYFGPYNWSYRLNTVTMGTFGLWLEKSGAIRRLVASALHGRVALALVVTGVAANVALALHPGFYIAAGNLLAVGYGAAFLWLAKKPWMERVVGALVPIGRMAITCYLGQTLAFTLFFYGYGLGMYGAIGPAAAVLLAAGVWSAEVAFAYAWLARFRIGPVEWLWRSLTYLRALPLSRSPRA